MSPPPAAPLRRAALRRRRRGLAAVAAAAALGGVIAGATSGEPGGSPSAPAGAGATAGAAGATTGRDGRFIGAADRLSLERAAGLLVILRFRGTSAPEYVLRALRRRRAGGVILFTDNIVSPDQLRRMTRALQRVAGGRALIAVDQEGGPVRRVPWAAPVAGQPRQLSTGTVSQEAAAGARDLRAAGVDVVFAPVADVPSVRGSAMAARAFSADPAQAARAVAAAVRAWRAGGVAPTLKHFPGLGGSTTNTDDAPATVRRSGAALARGDLIPFAAGIHAGAPLVMASHALYPALDPGHIASQSRAILTGLLRRRMGFEGVIVTDSLEARAVTSRSGVGTAAVASVAAGADLALTTGRGSFLPVLRALRARAHADPAFTARVRASAARVLALRDALRATPRPSPARAGVGGG